LVTPLCTLPDRLKVHSGVTKYLLKKWAEPLLPREIVYRTKKGFPVPVKSWFREELSGFARETLLASSGICAEFLSRPALDRVFEAHRYEDRSTQIYALLVLHFWHEQFVKSRPLLASTTLPTA
jgi:asparagine synthase (glutamine-hydrolysing)